ncbi:malonate decarboxylase beta subunit [Rhodopseudomonas rhenobacensis]|uniref:Malonate decarboxylase beta subunit n=1 Tax=Rhodopseudomonas rhenobacensis TaxID=87461 RepID=A0A7W7Z1D2_9BRAD|nr:biotin-independent malonate decarboxylase subunit beta [Rhodopseudomonas rhenobacensis]MBB5046211.1 malonate decarboxylase beta subunit [Rhodopseudomonas rhenobacensis]
MTFEITLSDEVLALSARRSYIELNARARALQLLDDGTFHELLGPFDRVESPWLPMQGIVTQSDDGCVVAKGKIDGQPAVVIAMEGKFQGGSIGEVCGMKMAEAFRLARLDNEKGIPTRAVLSLESGGVRLQEANMGELVIAEIYAEMVALRKHTPLIVVITGPTGCFGGMSLAAGLASYVVMTRQARLSMNGPEVIELEAGKDEFVAADKPFVWSVNGGAQRFATDFADVLLEDDADAVTQAVTELFRKGQPAQLRTDKYELFIKRLKFLDPAKQWVAEDIRNAWKAVAK